MMFAYDVVSCTETREEAERVREMERGIGGERYES